MSAPPAGTSARPPAPASEDRAQRIELRGSSSEGRALLQRLGRVLADAHLGRDRLEDRLRLARKVLGRVLGHGRPLVAVVRVGREAAAQHLLLLLWHAVLQLEGIVVAPRVAKVRLERHRAIAPRARLLLLTISPEEPRDGEDDVGVVVDGLERVGRLGLLLRARLHGDGLRPENAGRAALLQRFGHESRGSLAVVGAALEADRFEPEARRVGVLEACHLEQRSRLALESLALLEVGGEEPERHAVGAQLDGAAEGLARALDPEELLLELCLDDQQLPRARVRLERGAEQLECRLGLLHGAFEDDGLHPDALGARTLARGGEEGARALGLPVLRLELDGGEPDLLRVGVGLEGLVEDGAGGDNVSREPLLLGAHQPEHLSVRAVGDGLPQ
mmetsp:Transcript_75924/g.201728  ORF Transcript_75924/g.201728 Transcript_75924/m.201728 type:complete len:390 (-) Transcript_75924:1742-2911(-)